MRTVWAVACAMTNMAAVHKMAAQKSVLNMVVTGRKACSYGWSKESSSNYRVLHVDGLKRLQRVSKGSHRIHPRVNSPTISPHQQHNRKAFHMVHVLAVITTKPGQRDTVLQLFKANVPAVLAEQGCIEYAAATDMPNGPPSQTLYGPDTFVVIEKWSDFDALKAHSVAPHMVEYSKSTKDMLANRAIHILSPG